MPFEKYSPKKRASYFVSDMAKPRPQKIELGNAKLALYNVPPANATVLAKWSDLQALSAYTGKDLVDLAAVATAQG